ncbi:RodZ domain-containing protein [Geitlerinema sp. PCC 9228]|jgi:cytoskeletal protein RodZ|uniref:helix-turn-helix domain-containing protein n=1 Tax=Geitlerinema sp. PCC 9228 TaxID=111611 RepID=UPI001114F21F|nr:RodZ domain-containing protein [Geitlerinema sp. PCC 9228]
MMKKRPPKQNPHQQQQEKRAVKLRELGALLRETRQEKGMSVEEVSAKVKIRACILRAIEEGNLDKLPEAIYVRGLLYRYAEFLGEDSSEISQQFPVDEFNWLFAKHFWLQLPMPQLRPIHLYLFYILLVGFSVQGLSSFVTRSASDSNPMRTSSQVQEPSWPPRDAPTSRDRPTQPQPATAQSSTRPTSQSAASSEPPIRVGLIFKEKSWIRIEVDGQTEFEGTLPEGTQRTWEAQQEVVIRAGNAGGVLVALNGEDAKPMGQPWAVEEVTFKPNN